MEHALGKTPSPKHNLWDALNRAGRALVTAHQWTWRQVTMQTVVGVADQDYIELPSDFGTCIWITAPGLVLYKVQQVPVAQIQQMQQTVTINNGSQFYVAFGYVSAQNGSVPTPRMYIYPTPTSDNAPTFALSYNRRWVDLSATRPDQIPSIPDDYENALVLGARALACQLENQDLTIEVAQYPLEIQRLIAEDSSQQTMWGPMRGGANDRYQQQGYPVAVIAGISFNAG